MVTSTTQRVSTFIRAKSRAAAVTTSADPAAAPEPLHFCRPPFFLAFLFSEHFHKGSRPHPRSATSWDCCASFRRHHSTVIAIFDCINWSDSLRHFESSTRCSIEMPTFESKPLRKSSSFVARLAPQVRRRPLLFFGIRLLPPSSVRALAGQLDPDPLRLQCNQGADDIQGGGAAHEKGPQEDRHSRRVLCKYPSPPYLQCTQ